MDSMLAIFQILSLLRHYTSNRVRKVIQICVSRAFEPGDELFRANAQSYGIYIALKGTIETQAADGLTLLIESGLMAGEPHSATVIAGWQVMTRKRLNPMLNLDLQISTPLHHNVLGMFRDKMFGSNKRIAERKQPRIRQPAGQSAPS